MNFVLKVEWQSACKNLSNSSISRNSVWLGFLFKIIHNYLREASIRYLNQN